MLDGFIKCAAATPDLRIADCRYNCGEILCLINEADKNGVKVLVFPELCVTGCTCMDLFSDGVLLDGAERAILEIAEKSAGKDMLITVGAPLRCGGRLFNCAVVIKDGHILGIIPKKRPVNFGTGYELRNFAPAPDLADEITLGGENIPFGNDLLFCCDDLPEFIYSAAVGSDINGAFPADAELSAAGAVIIGVPAADIETVCAADRRRKLLESHSAELVCGYIHAGCGRNESTQDVIYGGRRFIAEMGHILGESGVFTEGLTISEIDVKKLARERMRNTSFGAEELSFRRIRFTMDISETALTRYIRRLPFIPEEPAEYDRRCGDILMIQAQALARRVRHTNARKLVIGISGGLDSTLALLVAVETMKLLGRENRDILTVTMPCFGTTARTRSNAEKLCIMLGTDFRTIDIMASVKQHFSDIGHDESVHDVVYENSQARERTQILMDIANAENGMVVGTGDLSELALGWATYNGDHMSMYGVNGSVPKTLVRHIVKYYAGRVENEELRDTLISVYDTPVSPELLPADENGDIAQKTEDLVGPYELHDFFLYYALRWGYSPKKIFRLALYAFGEEYDRTTVLKWLKTFFRRFFNQQFKRSCLPDGVKVGSVGLSPRGDLRMPSDATSALWQSELEGLE